MKRRGLIAGALSLGVAPGLASARQLEIEGARITLETEGGGDPGFGTLAERWLRKSAAAVQRYYGKFPVPELYVHILTRQGAGVFGGQTFPGEVPLIRVRAGHSSGEKDLLESDWVMVHEMIHLAFPWMNLKHNWMAEGIAVYVESIARVQAGHLSPVQIWGDFVKMMPRGLPRDGDGGFEVTVNWGRTYWGGAMFCLLADIRIRRETHHALGLQHALRAINAERDFRREWDFRETLALGDAATGRHVLVSQFEEMKEKPVSPDLDRLWADLGVVTGQGGVSFDDSAALSKVRLAIETGMA